eukprot:SAG25_NODE_5605_length_639_cov_1.150000_1_plen_35_part_10
MHHIHTYIHHTYIIHTSYIIRFQIDAILVDPGLRD